MAKEKKYDAEDLMDTILSILTTDVGGGTLAINQAIANVDTEKTALVPVLAPIPADAFYPQTWSDKVLQNNPGVFYGIEDTTSVDGGGVVAKTYNCFVEVVVIDNGQTNDVWRRVTRYSRAIEELFAKAFAPAVQGSHVKIREIRPMAFKTGLNTSEEIKVGGISLDVTLV